MTYGRPPTGSDGASTTSTTAAATASGAVASPPTRLLLVDDDPLVCEGLRLILRSDPSLAVVGVVHDGDEVVEAVHAHRPDVILMDVRMRRRDGITATADVSRMPRPPRVIILTTFEEDDVLVRGVHAGAAAFLLKTDAPEAIVAAVHAVASGRGALSDQSAGQLVRHVRSDPWPDRHRAARELVAGLTDRERDVIACVGQGMSNNAIATSLHLGEATVKSHLAHAQDKLGVSSRVQVGILADRAGLLDS